MRKLIPLKIFFLLLLPELTAQNSLEKWDIVVLEKAKTTETADYLTDAEKALIFYTNLARIDGELFANTVLRDYLKDEKSTRYTRSLLRDLKKVSELPVLYPQKDLWEIAKEHAITSGKRGTTGHQRFEKRYGPVLGKYNEVAENCAYGLEDPLDIFIQLLIDEGIPGLGHRKNLLNPNFNAIGVSIQLHKKYVHNCVMSFGKRLK